MRKEVSAQDARQGHKRPNVLIILVASMLLFAIGWAVVELLV